jgi:hypothetical protein
MLTTKLMVFFRVGFTILLIFPLLQAEIILAQPTLDHLRQLWNNGEYNSALQGLLNYRKSNTHSAEIDYMIATSACRIPEKRQTAVKIFDWMLKYYPLTEENYFVVRDEINRCSNHTSTPTNLGVSGIIYANVSSVSSKIIHMTGSSKNDFGVSTKSFDIVREIPIETFTNRLFTLDRVSDAESDLRSRTNCPRMTHTDNFILCSYRGNSNVSNLGDELQKVIDYYCNSYQFQKPEYFISVYVAENDRHLENLARTLHGLEIPSDYREACIGYSFHQDLSLVAIMQTYSGTFRHELFHLLAHRDFGDIPPWLDEGIAALYEVSSFTSDSILNGETNWRAEVLNNLSGIRPQINELINMDWAKFNSENGHVEYQAVNHATARYFAFYLQEKGKLYEMYKAFRNRDIFNMEGSLEENSLALVGSILGKNIDQIESDFTVFCELKIQEYNNNH